mgnify:CR=1 FL=1
MELFEDEFAFWYFKIPDNLSPIDFFKVLEILEVAKLFSTKTVSINSDEAPFTPKDDLGERFMVCKQKEAQLTLDGVTTLQLGDEINTVEGAIEIKYEPYNKVISVDTYTDAWMPIRFFADQIQIEAGINNSRRLKAALQAILKLDFVESVEPAEDEYDSGDLAHLIGFNMYYKGVVEEVEGLTPEDYPKVAPFFLPKKYWKD